MHLDLLLEIIEFGLAIEVGLLELSDLGRRVLALSNRHCDAIVQFLESNQKNQIVAYVVHRFPLLHILKIQRRNR